jgi:glutaminyl-tRNA synthetase
MPTISGLRRRGYSPEAIRAFCDRIGVSKVNSVVDIALLEYFLREHLNKTARRVMAVLRPLKLVIDDYPEGRVEELEAENNPEDPAAGKRAVKFSRELFIEREDFRENPPKEFFRLSPGREVRLKQAYYVTCTRVVKDPSSGEPVELHCTHDPASRGGWTSDGRKVLGTLHWVSAAHSLNAEVRLYSSLFSVENPGGAEGDFKSLLAPDSLQVLEGARVEESLRGAAALERFQFLRQGYFCVDYDSTAERPVFNRTVTLRDTWAKIEKSLK